MINFLHKLLSYLDGSPAVNLLRSYFFFTYPVFKICTEPFGGSTVEPVSDYDPTFRVVRLPTCYVVCYYLENSIDGGVYRLRGTYMLVLYLRYTFFLDAPLFLTFLFPPGLAASIASLT